jgi:hypothetical protein
VTIERAALVAAAAKVLDEDAGACLPKHRELGERIADRLGLSDTVPLLPPAEEVTSALPDWHPRGPGLFLRSWRGWARAPMAAAEVYAAHGLRWACVPVLWPDRVPDGEAHGRRPNRTDGLWRALRSREVDAWAMAYVTPGDFDAEIRDAVSCAARLGAVGLVLDVEREWDECPTKDASLCALFARQACEDAGLRLGLTSYGPRRFVKQLHLDAWLAHVDGITIPQTYDRDLRFKASYLPESWAAYRAAGARYIVAGAGLWAHAEKRTKTAAEVRRHLELIPPGVEAVCAWGPATVGPGSRQLQPEVLDVLGAWEPT